jgi:hypothetical protein
MIPPIPRHSLHLRHSATPGLAIWCRNCRSPCFPLHLPTSIVYVQEVNYFLAHTNFLSPFQNARGYLLSNATFQHLNYAMGVDGEPVETYNKGSGNALEIFFQAFGRTRGLALSVWVGDVFPSLITTVMDWCVFPLPIHPLRHSLTVLSIWTTSPTEQVTINTVLPQAPVTVDKRRKLKSHHQCKFPALIARAPHFIQCNSRCETPPTLELHTSSAQAGTKARNQ